MSIRNSQNQGSVNEHCPSHLINSHAYPRREQGTEPISSAAARVPWSFQDVTDVPSIPYDEDTLTVCVLFWPASGELLRAPPHLMGDAFHPPQVPWICRVVPRDEAADVCTRLLMYGNDAHRITSRGNQKKEKKKEMEEIEDSILPRSNMGSSISRHRGITEVLSRESSVDGRDRSLWSPRLVCSPASPLRPDRQVESSECLFQALSPAAHGA